jgi:hypothetical protein
VVTGLVESRGRVPTNGSDPRAMLRFQARLRSDGRRRVYLPLPGEPEVRHLVGTVNRMRVGPTNSFSGFCRAVRGWEEVLGVVRAGSVAPLPGPVLTGS